MAERDIKAGEELFMAYETDAPFPNSLMFTQYGFASLQVASETVELFANEAAAWDWSTQHTVSRAA